jgi:hypothetical protein
MVYLLFLLKTAVLSQQGRLWQSSDRIEIKNLIMEEKPYYFI